MKIVRTILTAEGPNRPWFMGSLKKGELIIELAIPTDKCVNVFKLTKKEIKRMLQ